MSDSLRDIMRKVGRDDVQDREQEKWVFLCVDMSF